MDKSTQMRLVLAEIISRLKTAPSWQCPKEKKACDAVQVFSLDNEDAQGEKANHLNHKSEQGTGGVNA